MLKQLPIKKEYLLIGAVIVLLLLSYRFAFKRTIEAWQINKSLKAQVDQASDLSTQPAYLLRKNNNLSRIISLYKTDTTAFRSNIISKIALIAEKENVKLSELPLQDPLFHSDKFIIQKLGFEGDFFSLTKVLNRLQETKVVGRIRSIDYRIIHMRSSSEEDKRLSLELYLELVR